MSKILIVGAGQAGLQLALGLVQDGHEVTLVSNRTPEDIRDGRVMSSQCMFDAALQTERDLGLDLWEAECPAIEGISLAVPAPDGSGQKAIDWASRLDGYAQSVDQRVKMPGWMEKLEQDGARVVIHDAGVDDLERYTQENDLVVVAAGKGEIVRLFERDAERSPYDQPMRALALTYVTGMTPRPEYSAVCFNLVPTVGEYFVFPALTTSGECEIMVFEGVPGGPMDCWADVGSPQEHLARSLWILETFMPWEAERCRNLELTDDNGILAGRFPPTVRRPAAELPSGRLVLGLADTVMLNDPITGQGSNNAAKMATAYHAAIRARPEGPFDRGFMERAFEDFWQSYGQYTTTWTNALLSPPPEHVLKLLGAGNTSPEIAHRFVNGFDNPVDYFEWFMFPEKAEAYLAEVGAAA
jgi:2-polyprenyl-6-methoxyphenol hydroxylase-like FAD-dependent oxidoreductase